MTELEQIEEFKKNNNNNMAKLIAVHGNMPPVCTLLVYVANEDEYKVIIAPIPEEALENDKNKKKFLGIMPMFFDKLKEDGNKIICFSYSSEAWIRIINKEDAQDNDIPDNWKSLPKQEVLISSYETADGAFVEINNIVREGKIANEKGELIDCIRLEKNEELSAEGDPNSVGGDFANIFRNYLKIK